MNIHLMCLGRLINKELKVSVATQDTLFQLAPIELKQDEDGYCIININYDTVWTYDIADKKNCLDWNLPIFRTEFTMGIMYPDPFRTIHSENIFAKWIFSGPEDSFSLTSKKIDTYQLKRQKEQAKGVI